jgi:hypothetical protein
MLPRKYVTATAVIIASSGQAGARISPEGAQPLQPKAATHEPPPSAPKLADHHPLLKPTLHHQDEHPHAAQSRHRDKPSRSPQCSTETLATGHPEPPSSRPIQADLTANRSRRSSAWEPQLPEDRRAPPRTHEEDEKPLPGAPPAKPIGPPGRAAATVPSSPTSPPAPTGAARAASTPSVVAAYLGPPPPDVEAPLRRRGQRPPPPFGDVARRHRGKGWWQRRQEEGRREADGGGGLGFPLCRQRRATRGREGRRGRADMLSFCRLIFNSSRKTTCGMEKKSPNLERALSSLVFGHLWFIGLSLSLGLHRGDSVWICLPILVQFPRTWWTLCVRLADAVYVGSSGGLVAGSSSPFPLLLPLFPTDRHHQNHPLP